MVAPHWSDVLIIALMIGFVIMVFYGKRMRDKLKPFLRKKSSKVQIGDFVLNNNTRIEERLWALHVLLATPSSRIVLTCDGTNWFIEAVGVAEGDLDNVSQKKESEMQLQEYTG